MEPEVFVRPPLSPYEPVSLKLIEKHLSGEITCGFPAAGDDSTCKWLAWDADNAIGHLEKVCSVLNQLGLVPLREGRREGRDGHLWLFLDESVKADYLRRFDQWIRKQIGIEKNALEFFPKQSVVGKAGSQVRGPLGVHRKPGANNVRGLFNDGGETIEEQLSWLSQQPLTEANRILRLAKELEKLDTESQPYNFQPVRKKRSFGDFRILDHITETRLGLDRYIAQCPCCAAEGHDNHKDNLHIALDGTWFGCWYQGWNQAHKPADIIKRLRSKVG